MDKNEKKNVLVKKLSSVFKEADGKGIPRDEVRKIFKNPKDSKLQKGNEKVWKSSENCNVTRTKNNEENSRRVAKIKDFIKAKYMYVVMFLLGVFCTLAVIFTHNHVTEALAKKCLVLSNEYSAELSRPLVQCDMCRNLDSVPVEHSISAEDFKRKYAYTSVPVLIKDATRGWSAMQLFDFKFFRKLYIMTDGALESVEEECQFFPYKTEFQTLSEVFLMPEERANFTEGEKPWYIGWSNCNKDVRNKLRQHYDRPYFLPNNSESSTIDWIFMGGSGPGALIHLDYVQRPSWQAQIAGKKTWTLIPSPECEAQCKTMNVTVQKGDIFVVDTNVWYHSTFIHPGEISITIGSEYD